MLACAKWRTIWTTRSSRRKYSGARFHSLIRELQPGALINNRIGLTGDFVTPEQRLPKGIPVKGAVVGNVDPNDKGISPVAPPPEDFQPWETCMTINGTWAYNRNDRQFKSTAELIRGLIDAASKGGNFLLNVGPAPEGTIQPEFEERLRAIGAWLAKHGESIYGTTYGPLQDLSFGRTTAKGKTVYLHLFDPPGEWIELTGFAAPVSRVSLLADGTPLRFEQKKGALRIAAAGIRPDPNATVIKIQPK